MNPKRERSPTRNSSKSRAATPIQPYYTSSPPSSRSLIVKKWAVRLLIVLIATLAVTIVSDLIKIYISSKTHPQIVDTESDPLIAIQNNRGDHLDPSSRPIILLPPSEIIVLWDLACLQLIPNRYLRLLGCTILPREGQSQKHVLSSKESFPPTALPKDNPERDASIKTPNIASIKSASLESGSFSSKFVTKPTTESVNTLLQTLMATTTVITIDSTVSDTHARTATKHDLPTPAAHTIDDDETHDHSGCIFCGIADNPKEQSRKVYEDERFVAFHDINPSAKVHLLIVPKEHIGSVMNLSYDHIPMLFEMKAMAQMLLSKSFHIPLEDHHLGFHVPPFNSISHLHLHVIARPFKNWVRSAKYPDGKGWWLQGETSTWFFGKGRWIRWWIGLDDLIEVLEEARERGDNRPFSWEFFTF